VVQAAAQVALGPIFDALERQRQVGLDVFTDGEFRRGAWQTDMAEAVEGFVADRIAMAWHGPNAGVEGSAAQVVGGRLRQRRRLTAQRIEEASECVPLENLALSPQCGFDSVAEGNLLSPDDQWRELELLVDTARRVWG